MGNIPQGEERVSIGFGQCIRTHEGLGHIRLFAKAVLDTLCGSVDELIDLAAAERCAKLCAQILEGEPLDSPERTLARLKDEARKYRAEHPPKEE